MKKAKFNLKKTYILITLFAVLMLNLCWWGTKKQGFYCDEMYSYHFVCQTGYPSVNGDKDGETYLNTWHTPEHFMDYLTITPEEAFDFAGVCKTIGEDVHPPVYYLLLEIVCSIAGFLLPGAFTKWCGIGLNMLFFALTILALFFMGRKIYHSDFWAALTCILYGISAGAVTTVMFLRMYMIFTFTCVLFSWVNFEFFKQLWEGEKKKRGLLFLKLFAVTVLGILNHYYFFLFAFFTCLLLWGCILLKKKFVFAFQYAAVMGTGIGFSYLLWPYMREDIFSGYRGVEAFDNLADGSGYAESIRMFCRLMQGELMGIGELALKYDAFVVTDEVYEHMVYAPYHHTCMASLPGMYDHTITCNSLSKTYSITGWRLGYLIGPENVIEAAKKVHDFLTVGAAAPLQEAAVTGLNFPDSYYENLLKTYTEKRDYFLKGLDEIGLKHNVPQGTYFVLIDIQEFLDLPMFDGYTDLEFCEWMIKNIKVAAVPGSSFFKEEVNNLIRLHFAREKDTIDEALRRLKKLKELKG